MDFKLLIILIISFSIYFTYYVNYYKFNNKDIYIDTELEVLEKYDKYSIVGEENKKYLIYNNDHEFYKGSLIYLKGEVKSIKNTYDSFYSYLNKKGVNYEIEYYKFHILNNEKKMSEIIVDKLLEGKKESSKSYLKLILFNIKDENNRDFYNTFSIYSLTYLIAVSGFHIRVLLAFFKKIFHSNIIGCVIVGFYLYLLDFSVSSYRAFLCNILKKFNKKMKFSLSNNDIISLIGSVFILINPSIMFSYGFIYSFLATFVLEIFKLYSKKNYFIGFYIYLINIPIVLLSSYKLNLSTLLFSSILSLPISFLYVFSFLFLFLDKFYLLYEIVIGVFLKIFDFLNKFNCIMVFGKPSIVIVIVYYFLLLFFFVLKERKSKFRIVGLLMIFIVLGYQYFKPIINSNEKFYFLNVGQGDCTVFLIPNSKEVILLDVGGSKYSDVAKNKIIPFLESKGINKIRKIIISHDDFDHNGSLSSLQDNFNVEEVIDVSSIESVMIGNNEFCNLNVSDNRDNDGSLVLVGDYAGYRVLLMGDASKDIERKIMDNVGDIDIIKIGHHGSNSSSDFDFLKKIKGEIAIISVGENNLYGHPHKEVEDNLYALGYIVFRTDKHNNIGFGKNIFKVSFIDYFK